MINRLKRLFGRKPNPSLQLQQQQSRAGRIPPPTPELVKYNDEFPLSAFNTPRQSRIVDTIRDVPAERDPSPPHVPRVAYVERDVSAYEAPVHHQSDSHSRCGGGDSPTSGDSGSPCGGTD